MAKKAVKRVSRVATKPARKRVAAPSITQLSRQLDKVKCSHLVGREVIEQQISDLARGKMDASYCQNWARCPHNGWGECTPDSRAWVKKVIDMDVAKALTPSELKILKNLKFSSKFNRMK